MSDTDARWMASALAHAARGLGTTAENPSVACLIVKSGRLIGRGRTAPGGRPHAEPRALEAAGARCAGATAYVTLEPCAHHGRTPPCAEALLSAGLERVVVATEDPDPRVAGRGIGMLRSGGINVTTGVLEAEARRLLQGFLSRIERRRPFVTLKLATTLDGRIAMASGESRWITGSGARHLVHGMRSRSDAVLVGSGTALADDPMLDVRGHGDVPAPIRIILDTGLRLSPDSRLAGSAAASRPVWALHGPGADQGRKASLDRAGVTTLSVPIAPNGSGIDLSEMLATLAARGVSTLLVEGGGQVAAGLLASGLVDEVALFQAGRVIGADGRPGVAALPFTDLSDAPAFALTSVRQIGEDTLSTWRAPSRDTGPA